MPVGAIGGLGAAAGGIGSALGGLGVGGISALGSLGSGVLGYFGAQKAAAQQAAGQQAALQMYQPYAQMGQGALQSLSSLYGIGPNGQPAFNPAATAAFQNTPGYQFTRGEGLRATDFGDSARGQLLSSNNQRGRESYASGLANNTFMGSYVQPLLSMAGIGAGGAQGAAGALSGIGTAQAGGTVGGFNALGAGLGQAGNNYMLASLLQNQNKSAFGGGGGAYTPQQFNQMYNSTPPSFGGSGGFGGSYVP